MQLFTTALDDVRKAERKLHHLPKELRWPILKNADGPLSEEQVDALAELESSDLDTGTGWHIKEKLRWIRKAETIRAAHWRLSDFINYAHNGWVRLRCWSLCAKHWKWWSDMTTRFCSAGIQPANARMEGLNSLFQVARARAKGYRNTGTIITMTYLIACPVADILKSI